jgi:photosystem II stability/assembly factor-like uncharacterized protein
MGLARIGFAGLVAALTLVGCSGGEASSVGEKAHDFRVVPSLQPTDGLWVVDPRDPMTLYAVGRRSLRSRDGGRTWAELNWPKGAQALHFARTPARALYLEVRESPGDTGGDIYKSRDEGEHWSLVGHGYAFSTVDHSAGTALVQVAETRISRSTDDGATWSDYPLVEFGAVYLRLDSEPLVSSDANSTLYIAALGFDDDELEYVPLVLVSTDAGATFAAKRVRAPGLSLSFPPQLSLDCQGRLYVLANGIVYRSSDAGSTWDSVLNLGASVGGFRVVPSPSAECGDSVYAYGWINSGDRYLFTIDGAGNLAMQALPNSGTVSVLGDDRLLLLPLPQRSDDRGRSWWTPGVQLGDDLALSAAQPGLLFSSPGDAVYRSEDDGLSWVVGAVGAKGNPSDLYADPRDANVVYARSVIGSHAPWSFISRDKGASFQDWPVPSPENPEIPEAILSTAPGVVTVVTYKGVYTTEDAGAHFSPRMVLSGAEQVMRAAISASVPPSIYAAIYGEPTPMHELRVSTDGGVTWATRELDTYIDELVAHPSDGNVAFASTRFGDVEYIGMRTRDAGQTWEHWALPSGESWVKLQIDPRPPHALYAVGERVSRSDDQGSTWRILSDTPARYGNFGISPHPGGKRYFLNGLLFELVE